jgi:hypothetical protein
MITANAFSSDQQTCLQAGANAFVSKPYKKETIIEVLGKHLSFAQTAMPDTQVPIATQMAITSLISAEECASSLPRDLLKQLLDTAICIDEDYFLQLIQLVESHHTELAGQLKHWSQNYYHEHLISFLETAHLIQTPSSDS